MSDVVAISQGMGGGHAPSANIMGAAGNIGGNQFGLFGNADPANMFQVGVNAWSAWQANQRAREAVWFENQNLNRQNEMWDWQQALQREIFAREDSSIRRRVEDLKAAGMSPILAAGQGARAGSAVQASAPQRGIQGKLMQMQAAQDFGSRMMEVAKTAAEIKNIEAQAKHTRVQANRDTQSMQFERDMHKYNLAIKAGQANVAAGHIEKLRLENSYLRESINERLLLLTAEREQAQYQVGIKQVENAAAQLDYMHINAAKGWLLENGYDAIGDKKRWDHIKGNPQLMELASKIVAVELQQAEKEIYDKTGTLGQSTSLFDLLRGFMTQTGGLINRDSRAGRWLFGKK